MSSCHVSLDSLSQMPTQNFFTIQLLKRETLSCLFAYLPPIIKCGSVHHIGTAWHKKLDENLLRYYLTIDDPTSTMDDPTSTTDVPTSNTPCLLGLHQSPSTPLQPRASPFVSSPFMRLEEQLGPTTSMDNDLRYVYSKCILGYVAPARRSHSPLHPLTNKSRVHCS